MSRRDERALRRVALGLCALGALALLASGLLAGRWSAAFQHAWLAACVTWLGVPLGCGVLLMLGSCTGGRWTGAIEAPARAALLTLPLLALLFLPLAWGLEALYPWADEELVAHSEVLRHRRPYLNAPFFLGRGAAYLLAWSAGGVVLGLTSAGLRRARQAGDRTRERRLARRLEVLSAGGLVAHALLISLAGYDWLVALDEHFYSTIFGLYLGASQVIGGLALLTLCVAARTWRDERAGRRREPFDRDLLQDLGKMLLACVVLHGYFAYSQFAIVWYGNKSHEIGWHELRLAGSWHHLAVAVVVAQLALPFLLLLFRRVKRSPAALAAVAALLLVARLADGAWLVLPADERSSALAQGALAATAMAGVGGVWLGALLLLLAGRGDQAARLRRPAEVRS